MKKTPNPTEEIATLATPRERQTKAIELFNQAMQDDDTETAIAVSQFVIGEEQPRNDFSASFQMHCLGWLARHYQEQYSHSADDSPEEDEYLDQLFNALWKFKWVVSRLPLDLNMDKDEIAQTNDLMQHFYDTFEFGQTALSKTLMHQSMKMGDFQAAERHFNAWQKGKDDFGNDCAACEQQSLLEYQHFIGNHQRVIDLAEPILSGEMSCAEVPHTTYEFVIDSLIRLNKLEKARDLLDDAIDLIEESIDVNLHLLPNLIALCNRVGDDYRARELLDDYNDDIVSLCANNRMYYLDYLLCVAPLNEVAIPEAELVAKQIDKRNDNGFYQDKVAFQFGKIVLH